MGVPYIVVHGLKNFDQCPKGRLAFEASEEVAAQIRKHPECMACGDGILEVTKRAMPSVVAEIPWREAYQVGLGMGGKAEYREWGLTALLDPHLKEFFAAIDRDCMAVLYEDGNIKVTIQWEPTKERGPL